MRHECADRDPAEGSDRSLEVTVNGKAWKLGELIGRILAATAG